MGAVREAVLETPPETAVIPARVNVIGAVISSPATLEPDAFAFSQLGQTAPEPSLFAIPIEAVTLEGEEILEVALFEPALFEPAQSAISPLEPAPFEPAQILAAPPEIFDDAPMPFDAYSDAAQDVNLETFDLSTAPDTAPLEAFALDFGDITAAPRPRGPQAPSSVTGHPNDAVLSNLFAHRVIGAGVFEVKTVVAEEALPPAATAEDAD